MERRLIDANALEADYRTQFDGVYKHIRDSVNPSDFFVEREAAYCKELARWEMEAFCKYLQGRPTIDAVEVVRCRECKKHRKEGCIDSVWCSKWGSPRLLDDYCSYGERREPDENAP